MSLTWANWQCFEPFPFVLLTLALWMLHLMLLQWKHTVARTHLAQLTLCSEFHLQDHLPVWEPLMLIGSTKHLKKKRKEKVNSGTVHCVCQTTTWKPVLVLLLAELGGFPPPPPAFSSVYFPASTIGTLNIANRERLLYNLLFNFENNSLAVKER